MPSKPSWSNYTYNSNEKMIKDELFDCDMNDISSIQNNDIDYTIIDTEIDPLNRRNTHSVDSSLSQKPDSRTITPESTKRM